jgi:DNA polymerase III delta prime subunit
MNEAPSNDPNDDPDYDHANGQPKKARKKRTRKSEDVKEKKNGGLHVRNQASLEQFTRPPQAQPGEAALTGDAVGVITLEDDLNQDRNKRRKTVSPEPAEFSTTTVPSLDWQQQLHVEAHGLPVENTPCPPTKQFDGGSEALMRCASPVPTPIGADPLASGGDIGTIEDKVDLTPKKQITITKSGKLVSSPPKAPLDDVAAPRKRRGRKPAQAKVSPTVTIIKYGSDEASRRAIGGRIDAILSSKKSTKRSTTTKKALPTHAAPSRSTHPFFTGKAAQKTEEMTSKPATNQQLPTPRKSAVGPGKLWAEAHRDRPAVPMPSFGTSSGSNRVTKQSGLFEASWPTRETAHVRNMEADAAHHMEVEVPQSLPLRARKLKHRVRTLKDDEEFISRLAKDLAADMCIESDQDKFDFKPPEDVRLPKRLLTTGVEIQRRVNEHLPALPARLGEQLQSFNSTHPAVTSLFADIEHILTPFDEGRCESQTWAQKYSPKCAARVLHNSNHAMVLKDWLQSLTVMAVGGAQGLTKADVTDAKRPPKKKRKKVVDDFIVEGDDEEDEEMVEIENNEDPSETRSFRRPRWTRNNNVILVSGPHGCGKSATVYAVAKELGFEVFEVNSGTRRSGKDIQDRVGDMTANHLVNHKRAEAHAKEETLPLDGIDNERMDTACQKDIDSGRQGTMMSFFKAKPTTQAIAQPQPKPQPKTQKIQPGPMNAAQTPLSKLAPSSNSQKQSLILFEEADILFEEDQQFWAQVTKLAAHSKRPIVITCNDERQIPLQDLPLAAVLRLQSSPMDLATDYMLVLAGREGHILERQAVSDLYKSKSHDLRASITELDFWCQMSVGDRKGGLEWLYQRWPPGKDVDGNGRLLRVASEGTYQSGMGWLSHNVVETRSNTAFDKEEELLREAWADWGISPTDWQANASLLPNLPQGDSLTSLERLDAIAETFSAADVFCRVGLPSYECDYNQPADPTLPPLLDKTRLSYTLDARLLQADRQSDFLQFDTSICTQTHLLARRISPRGSDPIPASTTTSTSESDYAQAILRTRETKAKQVKLSRTNFSYALDTLAAPPDQYLFGGTSFNLTPSSFDRTFSIITLDLAPYVRSIVAHEQILESQRIRLSNLLSAGGTGKRARTTRASRVALEGGVRETKRRDRWFDNNLNFELVMATAGKEWAGMGWRSEDAGEGDGSVTGTQESLTGSQDVVVQGGHEGSQDVVMQGADDML